MLSLAYLLASISVLSLPVFLRFLTRQKVQYDTQKLPPGPTAIPLLRDIFNIPLLRLRPQGYRDLSIRYGSEFLYFRVFGQHFVILNSARAIAELLDKQSAHTSDRPPTPLVNMAEYNTMLGVMHYGARWRRHRRAFWQYFNPRAGAERAPVHPTIIRQLLTNLLEGPIHFKEHIRYANAAAMAKTIFGDVNERDVKMQMEMVEILFGDLVQTFLVGYFLLKYFPFVECLPPWVPGVASFRRKAETWRAASRYLKNELYSKAKGAMMNPAHTSMVSDLLVTSVAFEAGLDTVSMHSYSALQIIFLAMSLHPAVLRKAHAELDAVVGPHRLPDINDRPSLVYIDALIKESLRWLNVSPLGPPHSTMRDLEVSGYRVPAGTIVIANIWASTHDPAVYRDPDVFRPERFIDDKSALDRTVLDPYAFVFGSGRRICPGRYYAEGFLFMTVASVLHIFDVGPPLDKAGRPIKVEPRMSHGSLVSYPEDCRCTFTPRSAHAASLVREHVRERECVTVDIERG